MNRSGTTNIHRRKAIRHFRVVSSKTGQSLWERVAEILNSPRRKKVEVNLSKINRFADEGEVVIIPGKVLGGGKIEKKITVLADNVSSKAYEKLRSAGCTLIFLNDLVGNRELLEKLKGSKVKIIK